MSRARLVPMLALTLLLGGVTSALAQEATPEPEVQASCAPGDEACEEPAEDPSGETAATEEEPNGERSADEGSIEPAGGSGETVVVGEPQPEEDAGASTTAERAALALATAAVEVVDFDYKPGRVTIAPGDTVVWNFTGEQPHTVTADDGSFDSGQMTSGDFSMRFDEVGTYRYYCSLHGGPGGQGMSGTVVVEGGGASERPPSADPAGGGDETMPQTDTAGDGSLPRTGGGPPPGWVFGVSLLFTGIVLWRVARRAEIL